MRVGGHGKLLDPSKKVFFLCNTGLGRYMRQPTDTDSNGTSHRLEQAALKGRPGRISPFFSRSLSLFDILYCLDIILLEN